jgi:hypothetical protein
LFYELSHIKIKPIAFNYIFENDLLLNLLFQPGHMRYSIILFLAFFASCDYGSFDKDKRQIMAKDYILWRLPAHSTDFDVISFREDTLNNMLDSNFKRSIGYTLEYHFTDSTKQFQQKKATVLFTPDGRSIITAINQP